MFERVPFHRSHVDEMLKQKINEKNRDFFATVDFDYLEKMDCFTGMFKGKPMVCGGIIPYWYRRGSLWAMFDENSKSCFVRVFRGVKTFLNDALPHYNRIEVAIPCDFEIGIRRARLLGFEVETNKAMRFLPDGTDCTILVLFGGA